MQDLNSILSSAFGFDDSIFNYKEPSHTDKLKINLEYSKYTKKVPIKLFLLQSKKYVIKLGGYTLSKHSEVFEAKRAYNSVAKKILGE